MDHRLFTAAQLGDVDQLNSILEEDPSALENIAPLPSGETILHIATLAGKVEFVKKIIHLKPSFAHEANKQGLKPLHMASARGHVAVVKEILKISPDLGLEKDQGSRTALHYASMKGRVSVIRQLIAKCPDSAEEVTCKCETAFHLAVKNSQFEALKTLLEAIDDNVATKLLNAIDAEGQTALQVALARDQLQASELLNKHSTPAGDERSYEYAEYQAEETNVLKHRIRRPEKEEEKAIEEEEEEEEEEREEEEEAEKEVDEELGAAGTVFKNISRGLDERALFVSSLLASVTYSTGLSPPENLWAINMKLDLRCLRRRMYVSKSSDPVDACPSKLYMVFIAFNTAGFLSALLISFFYRGTRYARVMLSTALCFLVLSYLVLTASLTPNFFGIGIIFGSTFVSLILVLVFVHCLKNTIKGTIRLVIRSLGKLHLI